MRVTERIRALNHGSEDGSAIVEFLMLAFLLLIPLVYLVLTFFQLQGAAFAAEGAARDAGRLLAASRDESLGRGAAELAARMSFEDADLPGPVSVRLECSENPCLTPGGIIHATVSTDVPLPLIPLGMADVLGTRVTVEGTAIHVVDEWVGR